MLFCLTGKKLRHVEKLPQHRWQKRDDIFFKLKKLKYILPKKKITHKSSNKINKIGAWNPNMGENISHLINSTSYVRDEPSNETAKGRQLSNNILKFSWYAITIQKSWNNIDRIQLKSESRRTSPLRGHCN